MENKSKTKVLFVCSRNKLRSATAEKMYERVQHFDVRSCGTDKNARIRITAGHIGWADWIFVMEKRHLSLIRDKYKDEFQGKRIVCLNIPDEYDFMDRELVLLLQSLLSEYIDVPEIDDVY